MAGRGFLEMWLDSFKEKQAESEARREKERQLAEQERMRKLKEREALVSIANTDPLALQLFPELMDGLTGQQALGVKKMEQRTYNQQQEDKKTSGLDAALKLLGLTGDKQALGEGLIGDPRLSNVQKQGVYRSMQRKNQDRELDRKRQESLINASNRSNIPKAGKPESDANQDDLRKGVYKIMTDPYLTADEKQQKIAELEAFYGSDTPTDVQPTTGPTPSSYWDVIVPPKKSAPNRQLLDMGGTDTTRPELVGDTSAATSSTTSTNDPLDYVLEVMNRVGGDRRQGVLAVMRDPDLSESEKNYAIKIINEQYK